MKITYAKPRSVGVQTLMYVAGAGDETPPKMPSDTEIGVGLIGAAFALFARGTLTRVAGAVAAGYVGRKVYKAKRS